MRRFFWWHWWPAIVVLFRIVPAGFVPEEDQAYIMAGVIMPDSASLQRTDAVMKQVETILAEYDAIQNATVIAGYSILSGTLQPNAGMAFIQLKDWDERTDATDHATEVVRRLNADFATRIKEGSRSPSALPRYPASAPGPASP